MKRPLTSLKQYFSRQILRWTLIGTLGSAGLSFLLLVYVTVSSCEDQILAASQSAAKAFRPQILGGYTKDTELQIEDAFHLRPGEKAIIRDSAMKRIYFGGRMNPVADAPPSCTAQGKVCWRLGQWQISTLVPIYFDSEQTQVKGYLELILHPRFDLTLLGGLFFAFCMGSLIQIHGLSSRFLNLATKIGDQLGLWAEHIRQNPKGKIERAEAPLEELAPMLDALNGLNQEITKLEETASESAKLSIIRGMSHDILSPVSQLKKYIAVFSHQSQRGIPVSDEIISGIERSLRRLSALAKQIRYLQGSPGDLKDQDMDKTCDLSQATADLLKDLRFDPELNSKNISIHPSIPNEQLTARIDPEHYERILDNLIRNAAHASTKNGVIDVILSKEGRHPVLMVKDTGCGIRPEIHSKIFDPNYTTRQGSGTGLGLAIVKQLCDQSDATVSFTSKLGVGTEFRIQFDRTFRTLEAV